VVDSSTLDLWSDVPGPAAAPRLGIPCTSGFPATTLGALRCWLQTQRRLCAARRGADPAEVRGVMRGLVERAAERGLLVEQLIVLLKELWATLPADPALDDVGAWYERDSRAVLDDAIRVCIEEFYAPSAPRR
jgi:hypothetical protein